MPAVTLLPARTESGQSFSVGRASFVRSLSPVHYHPPGPPRWMANPVYRDHLLPQQLAIGVSGAGERLVPAARLSCLTRRGAVSACSTLPMPTRTCAAPSPSLASVVCGAWRPRCLGGMPATGLHVCSLYTCCSVTPSARLPSGTSGARRGRPLRARRHPSAPPSTVAGGGARLRYRVRDCGSRARTLRRPRSRPSDLRPSKG